MVASELAKILGLNRFAVSRAVSATLVGKVVRGYPYDMDNKELVEVLGAIPSVRRVLDDRLVDWVRELKANPTGRVGAAPWQLEE